jgi:hypothetical protein
LSYPKINNKHQAWSLSQINEWNQTNHNNITICQTNKKVLVQYNDKWMCYIRIYHYMNDNNKLLVSNNSFFKPN